MQRFPIFVRVTFVACREGFDIVTRVLIPLLIFFLHALPKKKTVKLFANWSMGQEIKQDFKLTM